VVLGHLIRGKSVIAATPSGVHCDKIINLRCFLDQIIASARKLR